MGHDSSNQHEGWDFVKNGDSQVFLQDLLNQNLLFKEISGNSDAHLSLRSPVLKTIILKEHFKINQS